MSVADGRSNFLSALRRVEISMGPFHRPFQRGGHLAEAIRACVDAGIRVHVRPMVTPSFTTFDALVELRQLGAMFSGVVVNGSFVSPMGRAESSVSKSDQKPIVGVGYANCSSMLNVTLRQDGNLFPCCAGADITKELILGNLNKEPLSLIMERIERDLVLMTLFRCGPRFLAEALASAERVEPASPAEAHSICHLCNQLFMVDGMKNRLLLALLARQRAAETSRLLKNGREDRQAPVRM